MRRHGVGDRDKGGRSHHVSAELPSKVSSKMGASHRDEAPALLLSSVCVKHGALQVQRRSALNRPLRTRTQKSGTIPGGRALNKRDTLLTSRAESQSSHIQAVVSSQLDEELNGSWMSRKSRPHWLPPEREKDHLVHIQREVGRNSREIHCYSIADLAPALLAARAAQATVTRSPELSPHVSIAPPRGI